MSADHAELKAAYTRILARAGCPDPDALTLELLAALHGHGYRRVDALDHDPAADWRTPVRPPDPARRAQLVAAAKAAITRGEDRP